MLSWSPDLVNKLILFYSILYERMYTFQVHTQVGQSVLSSSMLASVDMSHATKNDSWNVMVWFISPLINMFINNETKRTTQNINTVHTIYRMTMPTPLPPHKLILFYSILYERMYTFQVHTQVGYLIVLLNLNRSKVWQRSYVWGEGCWQAHSGRKRDKNSNRLRILGTTSCTHVYTDAEKKCS
jgi:hypothetical protein